MGFKRTTSVRNAGFDGDLRLTPAQRFVLHLLAEHAHDDPGGLAWPTNETLASESSLTRGTVNAAVGRLRELGLIEAVGHRNRRVAYQINMTMIDALRRPETRRNMSESSNVVSDYPSRSVRESSTQPQEEKENEPQIGDSVATLPILVEAEKPKRRRKSPEIPLPDDWKPKPKHDAFAREKGIDLPTEAMKFRNHAATHDRRCVRWDAAFDNWLIASLRYSPPLKVVPDDDDRPYVPYGTRPFVSRWG